MREIEFREYGYVSYGELVESFGYRELVEVSDGGYEGDSYYLLQDEGRCGVLVFGWGSCSGCDALAACSNSREAVTELRDSMHDGIRWFDSREKLIEWLGSDNRAGDFYWHGGSWHEFTAQVLRLVGADLEAHEALIRELER